MKPYHWAKTPWKTMRWFVSEATEGLPASCRRLISFLKTGERVLAILSFHKIGESPCGHGNSPFYISEEAFVGCLRFLQVNGWQALDTPTFLDGLESLEKLSEKPVLITFDDSYRSLREVALPWLCRFRMPAMAFVATDFIGGSNRYDAGIEPEEKICDWDDLRELERLGVSIQSHGVSHRRFSAISLAEEAEELIRSKALLDSNLGKRVEVFSFPYGDPGAFHGDVSRLLKNIGYRAACLSWGGTVQLPFCDRYMLPRLEVRPDTDLAQILA